MASASAAAAPPDALRYRPFSRLQLVCYDFLLWVFSVIFDCFFREVRPRGAFRIPKTGPVIFVAAPHANQFVDPLVLMNQVKREAQRRISFLIASKSYKHPVIGPLSRFQLSIPVSRAQDMLRPASGRISVDMGADLLWVHGRNTKFRSECMVRGLIALPQSLGASEIAEIISDTELILKKEFRRLDKITRLLRNGTSFKVADKIDQKQVYQYVFQHLSGGNTLGIFPEGGSHDRTDLLPLKAGVAVMALGAMQNDPDCKVKIVPCGMNYFNAHKFRSRAVVEFGHPIEISPELVARYSDPETSKDSIRELLDTITAGLKAVTVTCEDYETLMVVQAARRLYAGNFAQYLPLPMVVEMNRRLVLGYQTYKHLDNMVEIKKKILHYNEFLKLMHLPDHHVEDCDETNKFNLLPVFVARIIKLVFLFTLALPGAILFSPVFLLSHRVSRKKAKTALANSTVKIKANDVVATWKILISMGFAPLLYSFYASVCTWYCKRQNYLPSYGLISMWFVLYALGVLVTYSALVTGEQGLDLLKLIRPLYLSIFSGSSIKELKELRRELSEQITDVINEYGIELFPDDFNLLEVKSSAPEKRLDIDSDEEEELKTQLLRRRRKSRHKERESTPSTTSESDGEVFSDASSLSNSSSYTNMPMFSDYDLHMNAKNSSVDIRGLTLSVFPSTASIADDFNHPRAPQTPDSDRALSRDSSHVELNFESRLKDRRSLSKKIKSRIQENRDRNH